MARLRIAMVGAGTGRGQSWMSTLAKLSVHSDLYEFCGFCEVNPDKRRAAEEAWHVPGYPNLRELLDEAGAEVILGAVPPDGNPMTVVCAARRGVHVLTEIPIAPTLAIADHMIAACAEHGVQLEVCEQVWLWAAEQLKRRIIAAGLIGEIQHARLYYVNKADYHGINGARMLLGGRAVRVLGHTGLVKVPRFTHFSGAEMTQDRWDFAVIEMDSGVTLLFSSPPRARVPRRWDVEGSLGQLFGEALYIGNQSEYRHYPFITEMTEIEGEKVLDHLRVDTDPPVVWENPYKAFRAADGDETARMELLVGFHRAVTTGVAPVYGAAEARHDQEILLAMRESARRGNVWVDLPLTEPTALELELEEAYRRTYGHDARDAEALLNVGFPQGGVRYTVAYWD